MRPSGRSPNELRPVFIQRHYTCYAEGSVLIGFGNTKVICNASFQSGVPGFLKGKGQGWLTAEYGMLPRSTPDRMRREAGQYKQEGRTVEIQRLIGRALRAAIDFKILGENTLILDCDVIQADGGTRTAAITGACVALVDAIQCGLKKGLFSRSPLIGMLAAISVGIHQGMPVVDLDYAEDAHAGTDMNVVMNHAGDFIEIQGTAERQGFSRQQLDEMLALASQGIEQLFQYQQRALKDAIDTDT